jgi:hypothetical protein
MIDRFTLCATLSWKVKSSYLGSNSAKIDLDRGPDLIDHIPARLAKIRIGVPDLNAYCC